MVIGYGFMDEHINGILGQALRQDASRRLLAVVAPAADVAETTEFIANQLDARREQVLVDACGARCFLHERLSVEELAGLFPEEEDLIEELGDGSATDPVAGNERGSLGGWGGWRHNIVGEA